MGKEGLLSRRNWPWTSFRVSRNQGRAKVDRATVLIELPNQSCRFHRFVTRFAVKYQFPIFRLTFNESVSKSNRLSRRILSGKKCISFVSKQSQMIQKSFRSISRKKSSIKISFFPLLPPFFVRSQLTRRVANLKIRHEINICWKTEIYY